MTLKINEEQSLQGVDKALSTSLDNAFEMESLAPELVERTEPKPQLLTAMFGGEADTIHLETNTIKYDDLVETLQLPTGKSFEAFGGDLKKDKARQMIYEVGSAGLRFNVAPKDYANKRQAGSQELMTEEYVVAQMMKKARKAWDLHKELSFATALTSDSNYTAGGPAPVYDYYRDVYGSARPAAANMNLAGVTDHFALFGEQFDILQEKVDKAGVSMTSAVVLCGKNFYNARLEIEKQEGLAREIRGPLDLASMEVPRSNFGSSDGKFAYQWFDSHDGFRYVRYSASIQGTKMIGDEDAYIVPMGTESLFKTVYAPAQDRENVNTTAQEMYSWSKVSNRTGVHLAQESNSLILNVNPALIRRLTSGS